MTAVAMHSVDEFAPSGRSPLSYSPFLQQGSPQAFAAPPEYNPDAKFDASPVPSLPPTPPAHDLAAIPLPVKASRPARAAPPPAPPPPVHSGSIIDNFRAALDDINLDECEAHGENALFVCDLAEVYRQAMRWNRELGDRVEAFFAVKCNPDPHVLSLLAAMGLGFDCASQPEIGAVLNLPQAVDPSRIIYANPCKAPSFIRHAAKNGVDYMTFDNGDELAKIKKYHPNAKMVLRILTDDSGSLCRLGLKFGAPLPEVRALLKKAKAYGVDVVGVSFHCGSGCTNPALFGDAVRRARWAFDVAAEEGFSLNLLDIGGGFEDDNFEIIAAVLRDAIAQHFPVEQGVRIIAEPGRYFVSKAFELATNIIARRAAREGAHEDDDAEDGVVGMDLAGAEEEEKPIVMYYINDGVYGAFNCTLFDHQVVHPHVLTLGDVFQGSDAAFPDAAMEKCSLWGPTCDSIDCVQANASLPTGLLRVGDWLRWEKMGAYTICAASQFNGFRQSEVRYTIDTHGDAAMEQHIRQLLRV
ncbi:ornithine decarboxylase [Pseudohyphozyma bogoriensis]|nr:ornithine decarboxylase [Pseudohyphozyma bogoriensis]